jgi:hypothetical protein
MRGDWLATLLFRPISTLLFPSFRIRFSIALLLTFFSFGLLAIVPLPYPGRELVNLSCWMWVFPSNAWFVCLALAPLIPNATYGYSAFNAFCLIATLSVCYSATRSSETSFSAFVDLFNLARICMMITLIVAVLQLVTGPGPWQVIFPEISLGGITARGAGIQSEPSLLAGPLAIYCALLVCRTEAGALSETVKVRKRLMRESVITVVALIAVSGSISVLLAAGSIFPAVMLRRKRILVPMIAVTFGVLAAGGIFAVRLRETLSAANGSILAMLTVASGSWRNVPDIAILQSPSDFLFPGNPADLRTKISEHAANFSPIFASIQNTYSTFAAGATTVGLFSLGFIFVAVLLLARKNRSTLASIWISWCLLYVYNWFFAPKFEAAGWVAMGLLGWLSCQQRLQLDRSQEQSA